MPDRQNKMLSLNFISSIHCSFQNGHFHLVKFVKINSREILKCSVFAKISSREN